MGLIRFPLRPAIIGFCLAGTVGTALVSPRFSIGAPSLVDDWSAIVRSPAQVSSLSTLLERSGQRFRPGWVLWNYVQWHTLGAPADMFGPNVWDVLRLLVLVAGLATLTAVLLPAKAVANTLWVRVALIAMPALIVVTIPQFTVDLARFGPQEPLLIGAMALGAALLVLATRSILDLAHPVPTLRAVSLIALGCVSWLIGVYQKEVSICAVAMLPFSIAAGRGSWIRQFRELPPGRRWLLATLGSMIFLPLAHVAAEVVQIVSAGPLVYGTTVNGGSSGIHRLGDAVANMARSTGSPTGWLLLGIVPAALGVCLLRRQRVWLEAGLVTSALAALAWSSETAVFPSRYYMPTVALLAVALTLLVSQLDHRTLAVVAGTFGLIATAFAGASYRSVRDWSSGERQGADLVQTVAQLHATGCPIFASGLDPERRLSLPTLVRLRALPSATCAGGLTFLIRGSMPGAPRLSQLCTGPEASVGRWSLTDAVVVISRCKEAQVSARSTESLRLL